MVVDRAAETDLIARAAAGDGDAFGELVRPYEARVYNLAYRMCGDRAGAFDLAQEALLKAYRALGRFRGRSSFSTWLYRIVSNTCLDALRRQRRGPGTASLDVPVITDRGSLRREVADTASDPETLVLEAETVREIQAAMGRLGPEHRLAILLRDFDGLSYAEMVSALGCGLGTVKSRLNRARAALREELRRRELLPRAGVYSVNSTGAAPSSPAGRTPAPAQGPGSRGAGLGSEARRGADA